MPKINLKAGNITPKKTGSTSSLILGIVILAVSLASYAAVKFYLDKTDRDIQDLRESIKIRRASLDKEEYSELYFFQDRLNELESLMRERIAQPEVIQIIAAHTLKETVFSSLSISSGDEGIKVNGQITVPGYDALARQIKAYKAIKEIIDVQPDSVTINENGKLNVSIGLILAKMAAISDSAASSASSAPPPLQSPAETIQQEQEQTLPPVEEALSQEPIQAQAPAPAPTEAENPSPAEAPPANN